MRNYFSAKTQGCVMLITIKVVKNPCQFGENEDLRFHTLFLLVGGVPENENDDM